MLSARARRRLVLSVAREATSRCASASFALRSRVMRPSSASTRLYSGESCSDARSPAATAARSRSSAARSTSAALVDDELEQPRRRRLDARQVHDAQRERAAAQRQVVVEPQRQQRRGLVGEAEPDCEVNGRDGRRGGARRERVGACAYQQRDDRDGGGGLLLSCERVAVRLGEGEQR